MTRPSREQESMDQNTIDAIWRITGEDCPGYDFVFSDGGSRLLATKNGCKSAMGEIPMGGQPLNFDSDDAIRRFLNSVFHRWPLPG